MLCTTPKFDQVDLQIFLFLLQCTEMVDVYFGAHRRTQRWPAKAELCPTAYKIVVAGPSPDVCQVGLKASNILAGTNISLEFDNLNMTIIYTLPIFIGVRAY